MNHPQKLNELLQLEGGADAATALEQLFLEQDINLVNISTEDMCGIVVFPVFAKITDTHHSPKSVGHDTEYLFKRWGEVLVDNLYRKTA
jgi:hypothetical protein